MVKQLAVLSTFVFMSLSGFCYANSLGDVPSGKGDILGGKEGDACQMLLCLSDPAGKGMDECKKPLKKYHKMDPDDRPSFLDKCPIIKGGGGGK